MSYFDAVTVHTYIGANPDDASIVITLGVLLLNARNSLESSF
jgi:hypothetical protein